MCDGARTPGTDAALFATREEKKKAFKFVTESLPIGTAQTAVLTTLQHLHVEELGLEDALRARARAHLRDLFTNADEVVDQINSWFLNNPDGTVVVDVALLYERIVERVAKRDPARPRWIHLSRDPVRATWACRGPLAQEDLVTVSWDVGRGRVQLGTPPRTGEAVSSALARLALHRVGSTSMEVSVADAADWSQQSATLCGGTLGKSTTPVRFASNAASIETPAHAPRAETDTPTFAAQLNDAMDARVWTALVGAVDKRLVEEKLEQGLRSKMRATWTAWHACLDADSSRRASFLRSMLATVEEWGRNGFDASVRVGPELADDLARTTVVALAVAAAFDGSTMTVDVGAAGAINNLVLGEVRAHVVALSAASHPEERKPYPLTNAAGPMLAAETGIAILGVVNASASDLFDVAFEETVPFHASDLASQSFRHAGAPPPILTANPKFVAALSKGVEALRKHLAEVLGRMNDLRLESLRRALNGAPNG